MACTRAGINAGNRNGIYSFLSQGRFAGKPLLVVSNLRIGCKFRGRRAESRALFPGMMETPRRRKIWRHLTPGGGVLLVHSRAMFVRVLPIRFFATSSLLIV